MTPHSKIKTFAGSTILIIFFVSVIVFIPIALFKFWTSQTKPVTYLIVEVYNNDSKLYKCNEPYITVVQDTTTEHISYKCGELGKQSELISIYE